MQEIPKKLTGENNDIPEESRTPSTPDGIEEENIPTEEIGAELENEELQEMNTEEAINDNEDDPLLVPGNEADVTREDIEALGPRNLSMDDGDDESFLKHREQPVDFGGDDLDVPGAELDDDQESRGSEDEENNPYSLGGDNHDRN